MNNHFLKLTDQKGIAMAMSLLFSLVLFLISSVFLLRVSNEAKMVRKEREVQKTFYAAQAASQLALDQLNLFINTDLLNTISSANPNGVVSYARQKVNQGDGVGWLVYCARHNNVPLFSLNTDQAEYATTGTFNGYPYQYTMVITEKENPSTAGTDAWDFPFYYKIIATVGSEDIAQDVYVNGDFTVRVQRDNFAKYALFTNEQISETGDYVWFTDKTNFTGPVHTNDRLNFALNPSGIFEGQTTQEDLRARFYNQGSYVLLNDDHNGTKDVPTFHAGFERDVDPVALSSPVQEDDMIDQATGGQNFNQNGIYVPKSGNAVVGGIYVRGNADSVTVSESSGNPVYTIKQGATTKRITLNRTTNRTTVENVSAGTSDTYNGLPDGQDDDGTLLFVQGNISSLYGTVQSDERVTIASSNDIVITNHLRYESYTPAIGTPSAPGYVPPSATGTTNLLGLVSWDGNVRVGTSAPNNVDIHASVLAKEGVFKVDQHDNTAIGPRGTATLLGGAISDQYGAFGLFNGNTGQQISGYGRNFVYDDRMAAGESPPYFPTLETFIAFTNDLTDKMVWQEGE